jgi:ferredoxin
MIMEFTEKSCTIRIDTSKCTSCETKACTEACRKYARGILAIDDSGKASVAHHSPEEVIRLGTECLACEFACKFQGKDAITIEVPIKGLEEYLQKRQQA